MINSVFYSIFYSRFYSIFHSIFYSISISILFYIISNVLFYILFYLLSYILFHILFHVLFLCWHATDHSSPLPPPPPPCDCRPGANTPCTSGSRSRDGGLLLVRRNGERRAGRCAVTALTSGGQAAPTDSAATGCAAPWWMPPLNHVSP